jgi:hypothetical protein
MPPRTIDGPGDGHFVPHDEAARWLDVHPDTLDRIAAREGWLKPSKHGRKKAWHWLDVFVLGHLLAARAAANAQPADEGDGPERKS